MNNCLTRQFLIPKHLFFDRFNSNFTYGRCEWSQVLYQSLRKPKCTVVDIIGFALLFQLLLLCGDIHPNPGPVPHTTYCDITVCHANVRSLRSHNSDGLYEKFEYIKCNLAGKFDIITISETWLTDKNNSSKFKLSNYQTPFRKDRVITNGTLGYGGVLAWVSSNLACKRRKDLEMESLEIMWLEIRSQNNKFYLCVAYRKPGKTDFWDLFQANINTVSEIAGAKIIITGDLNADLKTPEGKKLIDFSLVNGLTIHITEPTRYSKFTESTLDQVLTNIPQFVKSTAVSVPVASSDHCVVEFSLLFRIRQAKSYERTMWNFNKTDFEAYREFLDTCDWDYCFESNDIDIAAEMWTEKLLNVAKFTIPNRLVTVRPNDKPWYDNTLHRMGRKVKRLFHIAKERNVANSWDLYKKYRNEYCREILKAKKEHEESKFNTLIKANNSTKKWWKVVREIQKANEAFESIPPIEVSGKIITNDKEKASEFNKFFLQASSLEEKNKSLPNEVLFFQGGMERIDICLKDVQDQIDCLDTSKAYGPDLVSPRLLKEGGQTIAHSLLRLYQMSLNLGKVPHLWKQANIVPLHKKDEQSLLNNYRPVSLLSVVGKVLECIIFKYIYNFFKENFILSLFQSGFLPGRSTVTQLLEVYHAFCKAVDEGKEIRVVFLDISKAFDKVWHRGLLHKLRKSGIHGRLLEWFTDYLCDRVQRVVINGQYSEWGKIHAGVPQGSVLGPLLFLLYINDVVNVVRHGNIRLFADDTCLFIEVDDRIETAESINNDLSSIHNWSREWLVSFSPLKTKSLTISNKFDSDANPPLFLDGNEIDEVSSHKYL